MASVRLENVRKVYSSDGRELVAVHSADLEVKDGELLVLVGPSGCGKSTLLRMIAGLETVSAGRVYIGERCVNDVPSKGRDIAMVFQSYALYPHMTVYENLSFGLRLQKLPRNEIELRVREAARVLGLSETLERKPRQLSGGQRQRVALGRAIVRQPQVFLFDEPLSNLDARLRVQMRGEIARLHRRLAATMIYVTHDQVEAMTLGERIVVLREGRVQQVGPPLELYGRPENRFVAGFLGTPAMNFLEGEVTRGEAVEFHSHDRAMALDLRRANVPRTVLGRSVTLGLRPEDITIAEPGSADRPGGAHAPGLNELADAFLQLEFVESLGNEMLVHARAGEHSIVVRASPRPLPEPGESIHAVFDVGKLHFFAPETGDRIGGTASR